MSSSPPKATFGGMLAYSVMLSIGPGALALSRESMGVGLVVVAATTLYTGFAMGWSMQAFVRVKEAVDGEDRNIVTSQDLGYLLAGKMGRRAAEVSVVGFQFLVLCVYFEISSATLSKIFPGFGSDAVFAVIFFVPFCILCCVQYLKDLGAVAKVSAFAYCAGWGITLTYCVIRLGNGHRHNLALGPSTRRGDKWSQPLNLYEALIYSFEGLPPTLPQIIDTLRHREEAPLLVTVSITVITGVYFMTNFLGLLAFRRPDNPLTFSLLDSYGRTAIPMAVNFVVVLAVFLKYPLQFFPMITLLERNLGFGPGGNLAHLDEDPTDGCSLIFHSGGTFHQRWRTKKPATVSKNESSEAQPLLHSDGEVEESSFDVFIDARDTSTCLGVVLFRSTIVALTALIAILVSNLDNLIEVAGAVFAPILAFLFPLAAEILLIDSGDIPRSSIHRFISVAVLVCSLFLSVFGIAGLFRDADIWV